VSAAATIEFGQLRSRVGPHWHIYARDGREIVVDLRSATSADAPATKLEAGLVVVRDLATHLATAGYLDLATWLRSVEVHEFFWRIESEAEPFAYG
jgi:hypothetical protein